MKFVVLTLMLQIKMVLSKELIELFQIVFKHYFLVPVYMLASDLMRSTMCYTFKMLYHIKDRITLL